MPHGTPKLPEETTFKIVELLFNGVVRKQVARECQVSLSTVAKVKADWPLFFWKTKRRVYNPRFVRYPTT